MKDRKEFRFEQDQMLRLLINGINIEIILNKDEGQCACVCQVHRCQ